jgi:hypothetical protein
MVDQELERKSIIFAVAFPLRWVHEVDYREATRMQLVHRSDISDFMNLTR